MEITENRLSQTSMLTFENLQPYYGRLNVFAAFSNDHELSTRARLRDNRPDGVVGHKINDIIGRKVTSKGQFAHVFRVNISRGKVVDIFNGYNQTDLDKDIEILKEEFPEQTDYIDQLVEDSRDEAVRKYPFARFWFISGVMADEVSFFQRRGQKWNFLISSMGYDAFVDDRGDGVLTPEEQPVMLLLNPFLKEDLEIVSIQAFRKNINKRIQKEVEKFNNRIDVQNNRRRIKK